MRHFFHPAQYEHRPVTEFFNGALASHAETPQRASVIVQALASVEAPADAGFGPIGAVHGSAYLDFLQSAHARWLAAGREGEAIGYAWPVVRRRALSLDRIDALLGRYSADSVTPIGAQTWSAAYAGAQSAIAATRAVLAGERAAFALCRPPGHHAGADYCGGYCYLNNAAIAAQAAIDAGHERVAILDVDYHHGNGTQDIFYDRGDVLFASIHADPAGDFPYFWGHADETGEGEGDGATLNLPLSRGTDWQAYAPALASALDAIARFGPSLLVVSFGADTFAGDPIAGFALQTPDFSRMGAAIATLALPTAIVMEGGYAVDALGQNVAQFLSGF